MKNKLTIGTRLSLILSLAIASSLAGNAAQAESRQQRQTNEELSRTITKLVDLGTEQQWLIEAALSRVSHSRASAGNDVVQIPSTTNTMIQRTMGMTVSNTSRKR